MRGYCCRPTLPLIPASIHPLRRLTSLHYHPGPPWKESVHLPVKLGVGGGRGGGVLCQSACISLLTCGGEMDWLTCPDVPRDSSNCGIMEVGAEWPSAEGQRSRAAGSTSHSFLSPNRTECCVMQQGIVGMLSGFRAV